MYVVYSIYKACQYSFMNSGTVGGAEIRRGDILKLQGYGGGSCPDGKRWGGGCGTYLSLQGLLKHLSVNILNHTNKSQISQV